MNRQVAAVVTGLIVGVLVGLMTSLLDQPKEISFLSGALAAAGAVFYVEYFS